MCFLRIPPRTDGRAWVAVSGLFSYGLCFELSWGQFNVLAMACAAWGLYAFHRARGWRGRWAAYVLLCVAIQLKVYPAIFVLLMTRHPRAWRQNLFRWCGLGAANLLLLFALGPRVFMDFLSVARAGRRAMCGRAIIRFWLGAWAGHPCWRQRAETAGRLFAGRRGAVVAAAGGVAVARVALLCALATMLAPREPWAKLARCPGLAFYIAARRPAGVRRFCWAGIVFSKPGRYFRDH